MIRKKITRLIRKYAKAVGIKDYTMVERIFNRGDLHQQKRDLIAMRATIYLKKNLKPESTEEERQTALEEFAKTENLQDVKWPELKNAVSEGISEEKIDESNGSENGHIDSSKSKGESGV